MKRFTLVILLVLALATSACGGTPITPTAAPTSTPVPTAAPVAAATATRPALTPTAAPVPPTVTSVPAAASPTRASAAPTPSATSSVRYPLNLTDDANRTVRLEKQPVRIISLAPSNTEILFALGVGSRVVGVTDFCDYPPEAKAVAKIGGVKPNMEKIASLSPDLVLSIGGSPDTVRQIQDLKIAVLVLDPKDIPGVLRDIELVGSATGNTAKANQLVVSMRERMDAVAIRVQGLPTPRVFYELDATDPAKPYTAGPGSWHDQALVLAGAKNVAANAKSAWVQFSVEELLKADPEIILLGDAAYGTTPEVAKSRVGWSGLTASKRNAIYPIDDNLLSRPGPRLAEGVEALAKLVHPEAFK